jgi:tetratricopeptide (TPR) repeat protein
MLLSCVVLLTVTYLDDKVIFMKDMEYFTKERMDHYLRDFHRSLPEHLWVAFRSNYSLGVFDRDVLSVLQDYQKFSPNNGVIEIRFWYACSKLYNLVPIAGTLGFLIGRAFTNQDWHYMYFDEATGAVMSKDQAMENKSKNRQADILHTEGSNLYKQGKYQEAYNKFNEAYRLCTSKYKNEEQFKKNRDEAKKQLDNKIQELIKTAEKSYDEKKYQEAKINYDDLFNQLNKLNIIDQNKGYFISPSKRDSL